MLSSKTGWLLIFYVPLVLFSNLAIGISNIRAISDITAPPNQPVARPLVSINSISMTEERPPATIPISIEVPNEIPEPQQSILKRTVPIPTDKIQVFTDSASLADEAVEIFEMDMIERGEAGGFAEFSSPTGRHQSLMKGTTEQERISHDAIAIEHVSKFMVEVFPDISIVRMNEVKFGSKRCLSPPVCDVNNIYRTFDGSCNNPVNILVGMASTPQIRLLPSEYEDGLNQPRQFSHIDGMSLPCPRDVSQAIFPHIDRTERVQTLMTMQWGQFIDHDVVLSPTFKVSGYGGGICCNPIEFAGLDNNGVPQFTEKPLDPFLIHPECFPICISKDDPFFSRFNKTCMDFIRTQSAPNIHCTMGPREQMNALSHYIDGSMVYGSDESRAAALRDPAGGGRLLVQPSSLLPHEVTNECPVDCFKAGDVRANEQVGLTFTHTLWVREHNRLAKHFFDLSGDNEQAYQKARRLLIAQIQHITYNEFLPVIIGSDYMEHNNMKTTPLGQYYTGYNELLDPSISNVFSTAAYRFGHSMIHNLLELYDTDNKVEDIIDFNSQVFNPGQLHNGTFLSSIARGLIRQGSQICDAFFVDDITNHLFQKPSQSFGLDLPALNINRGRDHGLPPYVKYREIACNFPPINTFEDLNLPQELLNKVKSVYNHVEDIDVFVGMLLEQPVDDAIVGPTTRCVLGNQFFRSKSGDRYFYDNQHQPLPFTPEELDAIKKNVTLSRVLCDNVDNFKSVQPWAFYKPNDEWNPMTLCADIPMMDLDVFN